MCLCVGVACVLCVCVGACLYVSLRVGGVREGWGLLQAKIRGVYSGGGSSLAAAVLEYVVGSSDWSRLRMYSHDRSNNIPILGIIFYGLPTKSMAWWQTNSITRTP